MNKFIATAIWVFGWACYSASLSAQDGKNHVGLPRFAVISDTHFENGKGEGAKVKVPKALKNLLHKTPLVDAVFVVGDLTDRGKPEEYDMLLTTFGDTTHVPKGVDVYLIMGFNHDKSRSDGFEIYLDKVKQPLHRYVEIKGYPFITISEGGVRASAHNDAAAKFLSDKLSEASQKYPGKPIFVFMHVPPLNTVYGSSPSEGWGTDVFLPVLNRYPQAIVFSGHSHFPLADPRSIHQDRFTTINDGSTTYGEVEPKVIDIGIHPENHEYVTEGIIADVLENGNVEIERWDTYRNEEILPRWTVEAPHDGSRFVYKNRNGLPAPAFPHGYRPKVELLADGSISVIFRQAKDNEVVHHYVVEIKDGERVVASYRKFSQYYLNSRMPEQLTVNFSDLPAGKRLSAQVVSVDSYNNQSIPVESKTFEIRK
ncbi:MAG: metallophosphoesterase [Tannerella sp.]|nr:metallophosphoesterase [Tannerella sp.]